MQRGLEIVSVLLNSFAIFIVVTVMLGVIVLGLMKAINNSSLNKMGEISENLAGNKKHE